MTISIKPTASGSTIEQDGSLVLSIDSNQNVGIGTSSPSEQLNLVGSSGTSKIRFDGDLSNLQNNFIGITAYDNLVIASDEANSGTASTIQFRVDAAERMRIDFSGNVLVGNTSVVGTGKFQSANNSGYCSTMYSIGNGADYIQFWNGSEVGSIKRVGGTSVSYNTSSDYRLKENVVPMSNSIDRLKQLKPSTWSWVQDGSHGEGFLAHEAQEVVPLCATGTKDAMRTEEYEITPAVLDDKNIVVTEAVMGTREVPDYQGIDQSKLVPLLTAALQEAITKIEDLETRIEALEAK